MAKIEPNLASEDIVLSFSLALEPNSAGCNINSTKFTNNEENWA